MLRPEPSFRGIASTEKPLKHVIRTAMAVVLLAAVFAPAVGDPPGTAREKGYITMPDGVKLSYTAVYPDDGGRHPTLFEYSGYNPGLVPDEPYIERFVPQGYAYIGVNIRGTGCSGGTFDYFEERQSLDGKVVIDDFIPSRPWSNGDVGMIGKSYPGITQLFVAETKPTHLRAIAPGHFFADIYRDVAFPGGIFNYAFAGLWSFVAQPESGYRSALAEVARGDAVCARHVAEHTAYNPRYNPFVQAQEHMYEDQLIRDRSPIWRATDIDVPLFTAIAWQDEQVGPREVHLLERLDVPYWAILTTGDHGMYRTPRSLALLERFFERFLKGVPNGFEQTPRVTVWWEALQATRGPTWVTRHDFWPVPATPQRMYLGDGNVLAASPGANGPDSYVYPAGSQGIGNPRYGLPQLPDVYLWPLKPAPGTALAYTSEPLAADTVTLGSASLDLWLSSTAPDTDLQVTLTEVRADGQEMYVQKGWLRASHRALDPVRSTVLRPYQTHAAADAAFLVPGEPTPVRVEIFPFGHVFRRGSRIRVWIEAPTALPELWGFAFTPIPGVNSIYHDADHPSSLVLPVVAGAPVASPTPAACGALIRQPCRPA